MCIFSLPLSSYFHRPSFLYSYANTKTHTTLISPLSSRFRHPIPSYPIPSHQSGNSASRAKRVNAIISTLPVNSSTQSGTTVPATGTQSQITRQLPSNPGSATSSKHGKKPITSLSKVIKEAKKEAARGLRRRKGKETSSLKVGEIAIIVDGFKVYTHSLYLL